MCYKAFPDLEYQKRPKIGGEKCLLVSENYLSKFNPRISRISPIEGSSEAPEFTGCPNIFFYFSFFI